MKTFYPLNCFPAALPPTGPELANDKWRTQKRGRNKIKKKTQGEEDKL